MALATPRPGSNTATMFFDDTLAYPKPKPRSCHLLRRLKWLKEVQLHLGADPLTRCRPPSIELPALRYANPAVDAAAPAAARRHSSHPAHFSPDYSPPGEPLPREHTLVALSISFMSTSIFRTRSRPVYSAITVRNSSRHIHFNRLAVLPVETQRLQRDLGHARQLTLRQRRIVLHILHRFRMPDQVQQIRNRLQRIIDLMRDRRSQLPHSRQLLRSSQRLILQPNLGHIRIDGHATQYLPIQKNRCRNTTYPPIGSYAPSQWTTPLPARVPASSVPPEIRPHSSSWQRDSTSSSHRVLQCTLHAAYFRLLHRALLSFALPAHRPSADLPAVLTGPLISRNGDDNAYNLPPTTTGCAESSATNSISILSKHRVRDLAQRLCSSAPRRRSGTPSRENDVHPDNDDAPARAYCCPQALRWKNQRW